MLVDPGVEVKAVERHPLRSDRNDHHARAHFPIEAVLIHAEILRRISQAEQSRRKGARRRISQLAQRGTSLNQLPGSRCIA